MIVLTQYKRNVKRKETRYNSIRNIIIRGEKAICRSDTFGQVKSATRIKSALQVYKHRNENFRN